MQGIKGKKISGKYLILIILVFASFILSSFTHKNFFGASGESLKLYITIRILSLFVFVAFWHFVIELFIKIKKKDKKACSFLKYFLIYFVIMLVFLILTWPGIFKGDEFYLLANSISHNIQYMQHYVTNIFYIICLMIFPAMATIQ